MERTFIWHKTKKQGWREICQYQNEQRAAALLQRWTRGVLVRRRLPLASGLLFNPRHYRHYVSDPKTKRHLAHFDGRGDHDCRFRSWNLGANLDNLLVQNLFFQCAFPDPDCCTAAITPNLHEGKVASFSSLPVCLVHLDVLSRHKTTTGSLRPTR